MGVVRKMSSKRSQKSSTAQVTSGSGGRIKKRKGTRQPAVMSNKFQNDGSFLEAFKKMAEQQQESLNLVENSTSPPLSATKEACMEIEGRPDASYVAPQTIVYKSGSGEEKNSSKRPQQVIIFIPFQLFK